MTPVLIAGAGVVLAIAGLTWWFGPPALVVCGVLLTIAGLLIDEEDLRGQSAESPPRR